MLPREKRVKLRSTKKGVCLVLVQTAAQGPFRSFEPESEALEGVLRATMMRRGQVERASLIWRWVHAICLCREEERGRGGRRGGLRAAVSPCVVSLGVRVTVSADPGAM